jgi:molybdopterin converting factor small subunit
MRVTALFHGILSDWVGVQRADFEVPEGALFADLLPEIGKRFQCNMPSQLWDEAKGTFAKPVMAFSGKEQIKGPDYPLVNGQEITFLLMLAGG